MIVLMRRRGIPWDVGRARYANKSFDVSSQASVPVGLGFSADGSKCYVVHNTSRVVHQYALSTPWDVSTASYESKSFDFTAEEQLPRNIAFKPDGSTMYVTGSDGDQILQYTLGTAWDVSTASYASKLLDVSSQTADVCGVVLKPDGTAMFTAGASPATVFQYTLGTPWDLSTAAYASKNHSVSSEESVPRGLAMSDDGDVMLVIGEGDVVFQYKLGTPWDVSTASLAKSFDATGQLTTSRSVFVGDSGRVMFAMGLVTDRIFQYSLV